MQRAPLAHDFAKGARVGDLVDCDAGALVTGDVANAIAAGLDAVHVDTGQQVHDIGALDQWNPVELDVLARGEVAVANLQVRTHRSGAAVAGRQRHRPEFVLLLLSFLQEFGRRLVILAGNRGQGAQLMTGDLAVGHRDAQHWRIALDIPAVLQAQRTKVVIGQLAGQVAFELVTVLRSAALHELLVEFGVLIHGRDCTGAPYGTKLFFRSRFMRISIFARRGAAFRGV